MIDPCDMAKVAVFSFQIFCLAENFTDKNPKTDKTNEGDWEIVVACNR